MHRPLRGLLGSRLYSGGSGSGDWLRRQNADPYVEKSKRLNYRCRSAFKLLEIDDRVGMLRPGMTVVDVGAAPGSWTQVAVRRVNSDGLDPDLPRGRVISADRQHLYPVPGAVALGRLDFTKEESRERLAREVGDAGADAVLSDMAPNATGIRALDQDGILALCHEALRFAIGTSRRDASLLVKVWDGPGVSALETDLGRFYRTVRAIKPPASRSDSAERFLFAAGFKGAERVR